MLAVVPWDPAKAESGHPSAIKLLKVVPWDPDESDWLDRLAFGYGFNAFMILSILLVAVTTQLRRSHLARRSLRDPGIGADRMPRLLIGRAILIVILVVVLWQALYLLFRIPPESVVGRLFGARGETFATAWKHVILGIASLATLSLPILASTRLGNFVHIARDLIDHQYSPRRASALTRLRRSRDAEHWPRRARIQARLTALMDDLMRKGPYDQLIFVVHSQGSVIAFDYLRDAASASNEQAGLKPDLVTFGSPLTHLYEHYFFEYGDLKRDIASLRSRIGRWINLYRIDDYIGTEVAGGPDTGVSNERIGLGGHTDYWIEDRLGRVILDLAAPADSAGGQPASASAP
jgi:hypothetical protein